MCLISTPLEIMTISRHSPSSIFWVSLKLIAVILPYSTVVLTKCRKQNAKKKSRSSLQYLEHFFCEYHTVNVNHLTLENCSYKPQTIHVLQKTWNIIRKLVFTCICGTFIQSSFEYFIILRKKLFWRNLRCIFKHCQLYLF